MNLFHEPFGAQEQPTLKRTKQVITLVQAALIFTRVRSFLKDQKQGFGTSPITAIGFLLINSLFRA